MFIFIFLLLLTFHLLISLSLPFAFPHQSPTEEARRGLPKRQYVGQGMKRLWGSTLG